jgi:peptide-methionine (S)-S-oxide reductase
MTYDSRNARSRSFLRLVAPLLAALLTAASLAGASSAAEEMRALPPPATDLTEPATATETAIVAGGCFWGVQGVFQHVKGVTNAVSGYAGGEQSTATYDKVGSGRTGHAEAVQVTYDPRQISYGRILQIFFSVAHDPTQLNRQGPDAGTQYRSAIFPRDAEQARIAKAYVGQLNAARSFPAAIVTKIEPDQTFYAAEPYHQDFMARNPNHTYIVINDRPKVAGLKRLLPDVYRDKPALVADAPPSN